MFDCEYFFKYLSFNPREDKIYWIERPESHFASARWASRWNSKYAGKPAGHRLILKSGYVQTRISIDRRHFIYARVVSVITGLIDSYEEPRSIDHIDGNSENNSTDNLRAVSIQGNLRNKRIYKANKSGVHGVSKTKNGRKWQARIAGQDGRKIRLGAYDTFFDAVCARKSAEIRHGFHSNHGH